jgi:hypothetical protein
MKAYIEVLHGSEVLVTQFLDPSRAHEAQQELEYANGLVARVVRSFDKLADGWSLAMIPGENV